MARNAEFYKGSKKRKSHYYVPVAVAVALIALLVVLFYSMQKYAVITKDDVKVVLPFLEGESVSSSGGASGEEEVTLEYTTAKISFDQPDYSSIQPIARTDVKAVRAIYVPHENITLDKLEEYAARLQTGNALMIEMKPRSGNLMWYSHSRAAEGYGLSIENEVTNSIQRYVDMLKEKNVYLVAKISCCVDERYPAYSTLVALKTASGMNYYDETGMWLDPYSQKVRDYVVEMALELYDIGFDEVVLADLRHPVPDPEKGEVEFLYNAEMSTTPSTEGGICGFAVTVAQRLADRPEGKALSIYSYTPVSLVKTDKGTGQNTPLFFKLFDRVYYETDRGTYTYNLQDVTHSISEADAARRFVPVVVNYLPDNPDKISWVLIDQEE
ncbi:MAG: hypothetical protein IJQ43_08695 [Oscillospiraceae bacterium]|nr:hypothetical protein [Oscillospiraceae bacterium]